MFKAPIAPKTDADTPWTRLQGAPLWNISKALYAQNDLPYHNFDHVRLNYAWAAALGIPYSRALDEANLVHDAIYDKMGRLEERSAKFHTVVTGEADMEVIRFVEATARHRPNYQGSTMAMLDLASFLSEEQADAGTAQLRLEAMKMQGDKFSEAAWRNANAAYLSDVAERISDDLKGEVPYRDIWAGILAGIERTVARQKQAPSESVSA